MPRNTYISYIRDKNYISIQWRKDKLYNKGARLIDILDIIRFNK